MRRFARRAALAGLLAGCVLGADRGVPAEEKTLPADALAVPLSSLLADLPDDVRQALAAEEKGSGGLPSDPQRLLDAVFRLSPAFEFSAGSLVARTDPRWYATTPAAGDGAPLLELRRWPGDSVLALYVIQRGESADDGGRLPPIEHARLRPIDDPRPGRAAWEGLVETPFGERPALWIERRVEEGQPWLGALMLPGDAGLGPAGTGGLTQEMFALLRRVEVRPAAWKVARGVPATAPILLPVTGNPPGEESESVAPWQVARGRGFTIGLPPGFRARRTDDTVAAPRAVPGGLLWFRGRVTDSEGSAVAVGDGERAGYVARVDDPGEAWAGGRRAPLGAPGAERIDAEPFPLLVERAKCRRASAERWSEEGFGGEWLVFRIGFDDHGFEIGMPVLAGRRSPSLYWIAATWRDDGRLPAPPPVDPAERFGIRFQRLTPVERKQQPWTEGVLTVPGLLAEVSRGWVPAASLRSVDGYPVRIVAEDGSAVGTLRRIDPAGIEQRAQQLETLEAVETPGRHRAQRVYRDAKESWLFVAPQGHAFLFEWVASGGSAEGDALELWRVMMRSVRLQPE